MDKESLQKYVDKTNKHLKLNDTRLLTIGEQKVVLEHLLEVANSYDPTTSKVRDLAVLLCLETAKKVCEIHPDMEAPTEEHFKDSVRWAGFKVEVMEMCNKFEQITDQLYLTLGKLKSAVNPYNLPYGYGDKK